MPRRSDPETQLARIVADYADRGVVALEEAQEAHAPAAAWLDLLIDQVAEPEVGVVTSWLLRVYLADGIELTAAQVGALCRALPRVEEPMASLHVCQSVGDLTVPNRCREPLARFLREGVESSHKFVRAWAVDGLYRLGRKHAEYREEAARVLDVASRDAAASVRARVRQIAREKR